MRNSEKFFNDVKQVTLQIRNEKYRNVIDFKESANNESLKLGDDSPINCENYHVVLKPIGKFQKSNMNSYQNLERYSRHHPRI